MSSSTTLEPSSETTKLYRIERDLAHSEVTTTPLPRTNNRPSRRASPQMTKLSCKPSSCDRNMFHFDRFTPLIHGIPAIPEASNTNRSRIYLSNKYHPLDLKINLDSSDISQVDSCFNMHLYMDADTDLDLLLVQPKSDGSNLTDQKKILERFQRRENDSSAGKWELISRCMGDYMPRYEPASKLDDSLRLQMKPTKIRADRKIGILVDPSNAFSSRNPHPIVSFIPDSRHMRTESEFNRFWQVDRDGMQKAKIKLVPANENVAESSRAAESRLWADNKVVISDIDPSQDSFDLTSRWMRIKDVEILEQPIEFSYHANEEPWIESVEFWFQREGEPLDNWIKKEIYAQPKAPASGAKPTGDQQATKIQEGAGNNDNEASTSNSKEPKRSLNIPIKIRGLASEHFRVRLVHKLKHQSIGDAKSLTDMINRSANKSLTINSISFADACSYNNGKYCQNNGRCVPTGAATAECQCPSGYRGPFCEFVRPCDVMYVDGTMSGHQFCQSVGARCVENLPELRCLWPNDKFYKCQALQVADNSLSSNTARPSPSQDRPTAENVNPEASTSTDQPPIESLPIGEQVPRLREVVNQQAKLVIILSVFLIAIIVFALVLIGSMIGRLRKSKSRLEQSRNEAHELARRFSPSTSTGATFGAPMNRPMNSQAPIGGRRNIPSTKANVSSYNNSAFDVE